MKVSAMNRPLCAILIVMLAGLLSACGGSSGGSSSNTTIVSEEPSRDDVIESVRRSVRGSTYTETTYEERRVSHTCSQLDVELDPYMPNNPELARCPRVGATYSTWESFPVREERQCPPLPDSSSGWRVQETGSDRWRVSHGGSVWTVVQLDGGAVGQGGAVRISNFAFEIVPQQDC